MFHIHANELLFCPIQTSIKEVVHVQTLVVPGGTPRPLLYQGVVLGQRPTQIAISIRLHLQLRCS